MKPTELPVYKQRDKILESLKTNQVIVVESPTGSGKTTQIPVILHKAGYSSKGVIGITQPRRIAAVSVSDFIRKQILQDEPDLKQEAVGYKIRFEDQTTPDTHIKIMTDGILLQELKADRYLSRYSVIMVDEAHERSLNIDFIIGLLKQILPNRPDLKVIISSATINTKIFSDYFHKCPVVYIDTPVYTVGIKYVPLANQRSEDELYKTITAIVDDHIISKKGGDVLIFLSGEKPIKDCISALEKSSSAEVLYMLPLYGRLSKEEQEKVFLPAPPARTKVIVSTNIAETSVTIDGVTVVIDSGLAKINHYNPKTFTSSLIESPISQASANQRKGRAGRTQPGNCFRMYSEEDMKNREEYTTEEIYRTDLSEVVLRMSELEIRDFENFDYISAPHLDGVKSAIETLQLLGALDRERELTKTGEKMAYFPLMPRHSRMIVESIIRYPDVMEEVLIGTAFLSAHTPFLLPQGEEVEARHAHHSFRDEFGDFVSYLKIFRSYVNAKNKEAFCKTFYLDTKIMSEIANIKIQLEEMVSTMGIPILNGGGTRQYLLCISAGLIQFVCINTERKIYRSLTAEKINIHPGSVMFLENPQFIVAGEIIKTSKMFARSVSPLQKEWVKEIPGDLFNKLSQISSYKPGKGKEHGYVTHVDHGFHAEHKEEREFEGKEKKRDTSWELSIGGNIFKLKPYHGKKKLANFQWEILKKASYKVNPSDFSDYKKIRGSVFWNEYEFLSEQKVSNILFAARYIDPNKDFVKLQAVKNYTYPQDKEIIFSNLELIGKLARMSKKQLGFVTLNTAPSGAYWFTVIANFNSCIDASISSLDMLIEETFESVSPKEKNMLNTLYRKLISISEDRVENT